MIGIWHAFAETPRWKLKLQVKVSKKAAYSVDIAMEPLPLSIRMENVTVEGNTVRGTGSAFWKPDEKAEAELKFEQSSFSGRLYIPLFGELQLQGKEGRGPFLSEALMEQIKPYRSGKVVQRTDEQIQAAVEELLSRMSIADKVGQMCQCMASNFSFGGAVATDPPEKLIAEGRAGSVLGAFDINRVFELQKIAVEQSPLGIPLLFNGDIIHGAQTIFPVPLAWSCSWDMEAIREACAIAAKEASASGLMYNHGPMIDITRDPRWGRVVEGAGEDPYLGSLIAKAQVEGFQGSSLLHEETMIACLKHFIGYGAAEGGRDYNTVDLSEGILRNVYLPPFQAGIEAGAGSVMNAFNIYQGVPVAASAELLKGLLRDELGFDGILISDYGAVDEIVQHGYAKDAKEAARLAVNASMDMEMVTRAFDSIPELLHEGKLTEAQLDEAVRRIVTYKYKTGLMDDPFRYIRPEKEREYHFSADHLQSSLELARKSIVLLKNDGVLPLARNAGKIALIGPFADSKDLLGPWQFSRYGHETVTLYEGLQAKGFTEDRLLYAAGCGVNSALEGGIKAAVEQAKQAELVVLALGEGSEMSGEAASRMSLELPAVQRELAEAVISAGKPVVLVLTSGRPLVLDWFERHANAIVETWFLGSQAGHAIADVLLGQYNPSGRLTMSFPAQTGQVPVYYNQFRTGRPQTAANASEKYISKYLDGPNEPLYPFGYGLSYTSFEYSGLSLDQNQIKPGETLRASVTVKNAGTQTGEETVQLYIQDVYGSIVRPVKELKGFAKAVLEAGESRQIVFEISSSDLAFWTPAGGYVTEPGDFRVMIGSNSRDVQTASFELIQP
ncbi:glycoside hydrolase family 3 N-terminal domain-containing protein [Paenibacillus protaetiae]|uniref:Beta-glucosidase n=1 Tax=Paenibacillus protaetiae TaxID=2509456 RepID=A0A4P6ES94_9BACL|nr:glycoside hydrolase family 3 N-terminal domain-containing protein [Paenibacillus protaetiae]QAY65792.1 beta-glucosidase [Paenibacillus protaetiae]